MRVEITRKEKRMPPKNFIDLTGQKFGRLTVLRRAPNKNGSTMWTCECSCDNHTILDVSSGNLRSGHTTSCGCYARERTSEVRLQDLTGQKFGRLTVIKRAGTSPNGATTWECECDCENHTRTIVTGNNLKNGTTKSCGCLKAEKCGENFRRHNEFNLSNEYGIGYTTNGDPFYFDLEDYDKIKNYCWYYDKYGYVCCHMENKRQIKMHRLVMNCLDEDIDIDHINNVHYDNRKINLRKCHDNRNSLNKGLRSNNTSGVTGVTFDKNTGTWRASLSVDKNKFELGRYVNFDDAVRARKEAEEKYFKEWSYDNSQEYAETYKIS